MNTFSGSSRAAWAGLGLALTASAGNAQVWRAPNYAPQSYADYYNRQLSDIGRINPSVAGLRDYTYDRYFYRNPAVSPYLSLFRQQPSTTTNYHRYVLPEKNRREAFSGKMATSPPSSRSGDPSAAATIQHPPRQASRVIHSDYYKQFYGLR